MKNKKLVYYRRDSDKDGGGGNILGYVFLNKRKQGIVFESDRYYTPVTEEEFKNIPITKISTFNGWYKKDFDEDPEFKKLIW